MELEKFIYMAGKPKGMASADEDAKRSIREIEEDRHIKELLNKAWESFKEIMKGHELEKHTMGELFMQQNGLNGAILKC